MIRVAGVCKSYGGVAVLQDLDLAIRPGEFVLVTGRSGAGKTTLLRLLHGAERPDRGEVVVAGKRVPLLARASLPYLRRNLGFVFQDFKLLEGRTALANVTLALEVRGLGRRESWRRATQALAAVGLAEKAATRVELLSGGEQQRVALARAVVGEPDVILADEPTGNLDPAQARVVLDLLGTQAARGTTVLLATHDPMVVRLAAATRLVRLERGRPMEEESPREVGFA
ncbi:MAG: ABC transporter ATP-binding protein [Myxococcota bacterium]